MLLPDYSAMRFWRDIVVLVAVAANTIYTWWVNSKKATAKRIKELEESQKKKCEEHTKRMGEAEAGLQRLETEIKHLPSQADIGRVHARMDEVHGLVKGIEGEMKANSHQLNLILEQLLRGDK